MSGCSGSTTLIKPSDIFTGLLVAVIYFAFIAGLIGLAGTVLHLFFSLILPVPATQSALMAGIVIGAIVGITIERVILYAIKNERGGP